MNVIFRKEKLFIFTRRIFQGHGLVSEERFRDVFADCGDIEDSIIQRHSQVKAKTFLPKFI